MRVCRLSVREGRPEPILLVGMVAACLPTAYQLDRSFDHLDQVYLAIEGGMPPGDAMLVEAQPSIACSLVLGERRRSSRQVRAKGVGCNGALHRKGHAPHICMFQPAVMTSVEDPRSLTRPVIARKPDEVLFLSTGALVFRRVDSGRTRHSTNN